MSAPTESVTKISVAPSVDYDVSRDEMLCKKHGAAGCSCMIYAAFKDGNWRDVFCVLSDQARSLGVTNFSLPLIHYQVPGEAFNRILSAPVEVTSSADYTDGVLGGRIHGLMQIDPRVTEDILSSTVADQFRLIRGAGRMFVSLGSLSIDGRSVAPWNIAAAGWLNFIVRVFDDLYGASAFTCRDFRCNREEEDYRPEDKCSIVINGICTECRVLPFKPSTSWADDVPYL